MRSINEISNVQRNRRLQLFAIVVLVLLFGGAFSSCNKTNQFEGLELLIDKDWELISVTQGEEDRTQACDTDNVLHFERSPKFDYNYGQDLCLEQDDVIQIAQRWKLIDDFTVLRLKFKFNGEGGRGDKVEYWFIEELTDSTLVLRENNAEENGQVPLIRVYDL